MTLDNSENTRCAPPESETQTGIELPLFWRSHPAADNPRKGIFALIVIIATAVAAVFFMESILWGVFSLLFLFFGLLRFFLPTDYAVDHAGIREKFLSQERVASWRQFKRAIVVKNEALLSPYRKRRFMDRFRSWVVRTPDEKTAQFIAGFVKEEE